MSGETIRLLVSLRLAVDFFTCNVHKREMQAFNSIFALLWTGSGSLLSSVAF